MTHPPRTPQRRASDRGHLRPLRVWWERWGNLIVGTGLLIVAFVVAFVAFEVKGIEKQTAQQRAATAVAARTSCLRSRQIGGRVVDFYEYAVYRTPDGRTHHVFTPAQAARFRRLIPKTCPGK